MRCPQCNVALTRTDEIVEGSARQIWEQCPVCGLRHTVSEPDVRPAPRRIGHSYRFSAGPALAKPPERSA